MARRKKGFSFPSTGVKLILIGLFILAVLAATGFLIFRGITGFFTHSPYFQVRTIVIDPALQSINKRDLRAVKGKNIFLVNLGEIEKQLTRRYPHIAELKVERNFPDQISIEAKQRMPVAQVRIGTQYVVLDKKGHMIDLYHKKDPEVPFIQTTALSQKPRLGSVIRAKRVTVALRIAKAFLSEAKLRNYSVNVIESSNLSKIAVQLKNGLLVLMDQDNVEKKVRLLGMIISRGGLNLDHVKYIDLRFKEPILGKK